MPSTNIYIWYCAEILNSLSFSDKKVWVEVNWKSKVSYKFYVQCIYNSVTDWQA